jgi:curved DNA-binding protein CbpA
VAHPEDLGKLLQGPEFWNAWRLEDPDHIPDLRDAELTLSQRQFGRGNGGPIDLSDSDLQGMGLRHSTLSEASLARANLVATDLVQARLDGADLTGADLTDAVLDYADLTGANLNSAILVGASLVNVTGLTQEQIAHAHGDATTALPANLMPPESWFPALEGDMFEDFDQPIDLSPLSHDPYDVLGVDRRATFDEIRTSFRTLVKKLHPDLNPDDALAQERFKRVSVAYRILSEPAKRDRYDRGEIDADGDVRPEFEAKKEFRRYAFKFYVAAAASLILAVGILTAVWYTFWAQGVAVDGGIQTARQLPPKLTERLSAARPQLESQQTGSVTEAAVPPSRIAAVTTAVQDADRYDSQDNVSENANRTGIPDEGNQSPVLQSTTLPDHGLEVPQISVIGTQGTISQPTESVDEEATVKLGAHLGTSGAAVINQVAEPETTQKLASLGDAEAPSIPENRVDEKAELNSTDENDKSYTLSKEESAGLARESSYKPVMPAAHAEIFKRRLADGGILKNEISDIFRESAVREILRADARQSAETIDALQLPRFTELEKDALDLTFDLAPSAEHHNNSATAIQINESAAALFLSEMATTGIDEAGGEPVVVGAKTADKAFNSPAVSASRH